MKNWTLYTLVVLLLAITQSLNAQTCNDPNAHNFGQMGTCETCFDNIKNGDEIEVDCGGTNPSCVPCVFTRRLDVIGDGRVFGNLEVQRNIGIGTSTPSGNLEVVGDGYNTVGGFPAGQLQVRSTSSSVNGGALISGHNSASGNTQLWYMGSGNTVSDQSVVLMNRQTDRLILGTNDVKRVDISGDGSLTLENNLSLPFNATDNDVFNYSNRFDYKITSSNNGLFFSVSNGFNNRRAFIQSGHESPAFSSSIGELVLNPFGGDVGIGDTTPDFTLDVNGSAGKPGGGSWSNASDRRLKQDIEDFKDGLEEVLQIHPVWYRYNGKFGLPTDERYVGIIAQEMKEVAPYTIKPYTDKDEETGESGEYLNYNGTAVTYMLVNAVQEQQIIIEEKDKRIDELEARLAKIEATLFGKDKANSKTDKSSSVVLTNAQLYNNQPNPFTGSTTLRHFIPESVVQAELRITNANGETIKVLNIIDRGEGQTTLAAYALSAGSYFYTLVLDGKVLETKQMVLVE
ncbi:MAG: tail fiber domain-containing protein [Bacteroidota bacterium]